MKFNHATMDLEIFRLHKEEKKTIHQLAKMHQLSEIRVWNIYIAIKKQELPPLND